MKNNILNQNQMDQNDFVFPRLRPDGDSQQPGITLFYYYAAHAPEVIPEWFKHIPMEKKHGKYPSWEEGKTDEEKKIFKEWQHDGIYDLPDEQQWFQKKCMDWDNANAAWEMQDKEDRYFQWRGYYAKNLIKTLNDIQ